ncbi:hypothetical protein EOL94_02885 [bacterium]|nr:hypothetical protein [bacterium]
MNFFDFQKLNDINFIQEHIKIIERNILSNSISYPFVDKINRVLNHFEGNNEQITIIKNKIKEAQDIECFYDVITELLIIYEYLDENAEFIKESESKTPDIKTDKYLIEVKRVRLSDDQISALDELTNKKNKMIISSSTVADVKKNDEPQALNKKIEEKIDNAIKQIGDKEGIVYIIFSLDLTGHYQDLESRKKIFRCYCFDYFNFKQIKNIKLFVNDLNDII